MPPEPTYRGLGNPQSEFEFDVAISYAGEDRAYAEQIAGALSAANFSVAHDQYMEREFMGERLPDLFARMFLTASRHALLVVSRHYLEKRWTLFEAELAIAREKKEKGYLWCMCLDNARLPNLDDTIVYMTAERTSPARLVGLMVGKLRKPAAGKPLPLRVPRNDEEVFALRMSRPDNWKTLLFFAEIINEVELLKDGLQDLRSGLRAGVVADLPMSEAPRWFSSRIRQLDASCRDLQRIFDANVLGEAGESGDPEAISHLARRYAVSFRTVLDVALQFSQTSLPPVLKLVCEAAVALATNLVERMDTFVETSVTKLDEDPSYQLELTLDLRTDPELAERSRTAWTAVDSELGDAGST